MRAAQRATSIPIVMIAPTDPRVMDVAGLAHPGGNLTGLTVGQPEVTSEKRLQLFRRMVHALVRPAAPRASAHSIDAAVFTVREKEISDVDASCSSSCCRVRTVPA